MRFFYVLFIVSVISSCGNNAKEIAGIYVKNPSVNTVDSLFLYEKVLNLKTVNNSDVYCYVQKFYDKKTKRLLFENKSTWWLNKNGRVELDNLYLDADNNPDDYSHSKEAIENALISSSLPYINGKIVVDEDRKVYYLKINK